MKIGIIGAMDMETEVLTNAMEYTEKTSFGKMDFYSGSLYGIPVVVSKCGVGKVGAACSVQALCDVYNVTHIINTGIAGSLDDAMDVGDVVISTDAMYHDYDVTMFGYAKCQAAGTDIVAFPADPFLADLAFRGAETVHPGHTYRGRVASGDQFICTREKKDAIIRDTGARCVEMEGAAVAHAAWRNNIPFVIVRMVSDKADESIFECYPEEEIANRCASVTLNVIREMSAK